MKEALKASADLSSHLFEALVKCSTRDPRSAHNPHWSMSSSPHWSMSSSLVVLLVVLLAVTTTSALQPLPSSVRTSVALRASEDPLASAAAAVESIWTLPCTQEGPMRAHMTRERREATYAILWGRREWELHTSRDRYLQVLLRWPWSKLARGLAPTLALLATWSYVVWRKHLTVTANGLGFLASPIGLLLAFRVNSCVARFHAAREIWGTMTYTARNLASTLSSCSPHEIDASTRASCLRYLVAYAWCAKAASAFDDPATLAPLLEALLEAEDARDVAAARKPALKVLSLLKRATVALPIEGSHVQKGVYAAISDLDRLYGGIERLLSTPLAPMYMRHYQRGLLLWLAMLPCGLVKAGCTTAAKLALVVVSVSYLMLGIDEIGIQIEQPFAVMPVHALAAGLTRDVTDALAA